MTKVIYITNVNLLMNNLLNSARDVNLGINGVPPSANVKTLLHVIQTLDITETHNDQSFS